MSDPDWKTLVVELVEPLRDFIDHEPYLSHKYGYPALLARTDAALFGISATEAFAAGHPADCDDCARKPQDLRDPLPPQALKEHEHGLGQRLGMWLVSCRCGWRSGRSKSMGDVLTEHLEHVRSAWESRQDRGRTTEVVHENPLLAPSYRDGNPVPHHFVVACGCGWSLSGPATRELAAQAWRDHVATSRDRINQTP